MTEIAPDPELPAASTATALIGFGPSASETVVVNAPPVSGTLAPFTVKPVIGLASVTVPLTTTESAAVSKPSAGVVIVTTGGVVSRVTPTCALAEPAALVAVAMSVFAPSARGTTALYVDPESVAATPFTLIETPAPLKLPVTATEAVASSAALAGDPIEIVGALPTGGVPEAIPSFAEPSGPSVDWMRTPNTQPCVEAPVRLAIESPGACSRNVAVVIAPPALPFWPRRTPQSQEVTGFIAFPAPTFDTLFLLVWNCVTTPTQGTESCGTSVSGVTLPKSPSKSPCPAGMDTVMSTPSPPGASVNVIVVCTESPAIGVEKT
ncbi:MAG: hypothetical protein WEF50_07090 [Myxococcota bacterium]